MKFIWAKGLSEEKNVTLAFVWKCNEEQREVAFSLCAKNAYKIYKNGEMIGAGPARTAHGYVRKDRYFWERLCKDDVIVVEVCAYNVRCLSVAGNNPCFASEITANGKQIADSFDFQCYRLTDRKQKVLRYSFQRAFVESYDMQQCRTALYKSDASAYPSMLTETVASPQILSRNVPYPTYEEARVFSPVERGTIQEKTEYEVWQNRAHEITEKFDGFPLQDLEEDVREEVCKMDFVVDDTRTPMYFTENQYGVFDFERILSGFFKMQVEVHSDAVLYLVYEEVDSNENGKGIVLDFKRSETCNIIKYTLKKGLYNLSAFEPVSARYVRVCVTQGEVDIHNFGFTLVENPYPQKIRYLIQDEALSKIVRSAQNTLAQNSVDLLMDCPSRERAGWINDSFFSGRAEYVLTGENLALYNLLEGYALSPELDDLPKGMVPMCYPGDFPDKDFIPQNAMWFIIVLHDYYQRTKDQRLIDLCKEKAYGILGYFSKFENEFGLLEDLDGWKFIEWSMANDPAFVCGVNFPTNMQYSKMLRCMGELYQDHSLIVKAEKMQERIRELSFDGKFFNDNAVRNGKELVRTNNTTETCQYFAFFFGVASRTDYAELYNTLMQEFGYGRKEDEYPTVYPSNALIGFLLRLDLLRQDKQYEKLLNEVKAYYTKMAMMTGTLWEHKDTRASLNHGFASYVATFILEALGFIVPIF